MQYLKQCHEMRQQVLLTVQCVLLVQHNLKVSHGISRTMDYRMKLHDFAITDSGLLNFWQICHTRQCSNFLKNFE